jgi:predicted nucleic acid-binding protein
MSQSSLVYLDTSAASKLIFDESETEALRAFLCEWPRQVSSQLVEIELTRTVRRKAQGRIVLLDNVFANMYLRPIGDDVVILAGLVEPATLKSLDAIHLATAVLLREAIGCFVTYDTRLAEAGRAIGLPVVAPV